MNDRQLQIEEISLVGAAAPAAPAMPALPPMSPATRLLGLIRSRNYLVQNERFDITKAEEAFWSAGTPNLHITDLPC